MVWMSFSVGSWLWSAFIKRKKCQGESRGTFRFGNAGGGELPLGASNAQFCSS